MGGSSTQTTSQTQTNRPDPYAYEAYKSLLGPAQKLAKTPYNPKTELQVASLTPQQQQAFDQIGALQGGYQPYLNQATEMTTGAAGPISAEAIQGYMDPYMQEVVNATMANLTETQRQQQRQVIGNAITQGALGGGMTKAAQAELARQQGLASGQTLADLRSRGYGQALSAAQQDAQRQLAAGQQMGSLGQLGQQLGLQGSQALYGAGTAQQAQEQAILDAATKNEQAQTMWPYQNQQWLASILSGLGPLMGGTTTGTGTSTTEEQPGWGQYAGMAGMALMMLSDRRAKEGIEAIGETYDGQPIYRYRLKGSPATEIGLIAQDVEHKHPEAVGERGGLKMVNYAEATNDAAERGHFADGGGIDSAMPMNNFFPWSPIRPASPIFPQLTQSQSGGQQQGKKQPPNIQEMMDLGKKARAGLADLFGSNTFSQEAMHSGSGISGLSGLFSGGGGGNGMGGLLSGIGGLFGLANGGAVPVISYADGGEIYEPSIISKMYQNLFSPNEQRPIWETWAPPPFPERSPFTTSAVRTTPISDGWSPQIQSTSMPIQQPQEPQLSLADLMRMPSTGGVARETKRGIDEAPADIVSQVSLSAPIQERAPTQTMQTAFPNITAGGGFESGTPDRIKSLSNYSKDRGGSRSFGAYGLNTLPGNSAWTFRNEFGQDLGITADPSTSAFKQEWDTVTRENPQALIAAEDAWYQKHVAVPTMRGLRSVGIPDEIASDPRVQAFAADRVDQYGNVLAFGKRHTARWQDALETSGGDPEVLITSMAQHDKEGIGTDFRTYLRENPRHIPGLMNRVDKRTAAALGVSGVIPGAPHYADAGATTQMDARVTPEVLAGGVRQPPLPRPSQNITALTPQTFQSGVDPISSILTSLQPQQSGGILKRLLGIDFNPLKLSDDERTALFSAASSLASNGNVGQAGLSGLRALQESRQLRGSQAMDALKLALEMRKAGQTGKSFAQIGTDERGKPRYGFVDLNTGTVSPTDTGAATGPAQPWAVTKGQEAVDKNFAKEYVEFKGEGQSSVIKRLDQLREAHKALLSGKKNISGPLIGLLPDQAAAFINPEAIDIRELIEEVAQSNLREVLGGQFAQKEGEQLIRRAFNPKLDERVNAKRLGRLIDQIDSAYKSKQAMSNYYEEHGTLTGYKGQKPSQFSISDLDKESPKKMGAIERPVGVSEVKAKVDAREAIAKGADRLEIINRLKSMGIDTTGL